MRLNGDMYRVVYCKLTIKDIQKLMSAKLGKKAKSLVDIIRENPFQNPPPYEELIGNLQGIISRRINIQHRLVYQVINEPIDIEGELYKGTVTIIRMWTHYENV